MNVITIYLVLAMICTIYAMVLAWMQHHPRWNYAPDWTWLTVVVGDAIIMVFIGLLFIYGHESVWTVGGCFVVAGIPVIVWQLWDTYRRRRELAIYQGQGKSDG